MGQGGVFGAKVIDVSSTSATLIIGTPHSCKNTAVFAHLMRCAWSNSLVQNVCSVVVCSMEQFLLDIYLIMLNLGCLLSFHENFLQVWILFQQNLLILLYC